MLTTDRTADDELIGWLRDAPQRLRTTPTPLVLLIPRLQQAADRLTELVAQIAALIATLHAEQDRTHRYLTRAEAAEARVAKLTRERGGHAPDCAGMDLAANRCGCGYLDGTAYRDLVARLAAAEARVAELTGKRCVWKYTDDDFGGTYATGCGSMFTVDLENTVATFCPYCGGRIELEGEK
jgi:hypothetical protein